MADRDSVILVDRIEPLILEIRGQKVLLDNDLAALYGVATKVLNQAVKRNRDRFPPDFTFQLNANEKKEVVTNCDHLAKLRFSPRLPYAFTEHGTIMAATILNSPRAVEVRVFVVRAFVDDLAGEALVANALIDSALSYANSPNHTRNLQPSWRNSNARYPAMRQLMTPLPDPSPKRRIGFGRDLE
jgi:hypothetical protein